MSGEWTDTGEIERELDDTRSRLDDTVGALQQKLAPGTMVDQAVEYFTEGGGMELGRNLGRSLRDNPIPVALIGVGLGWLLLANSRQTNGGAQGWREGRRMRDDQFGGGSGTRHLWSLPQQAVAHRSRRTSRCRTRRPRVMIW